MSDAVTALNGATFEGYVKVKDAGLRGMVTIRADISVAKTAKAIAKAAGVPVPAMGGVQEADGKALCWMSPDEVLLICAYDQAGAMCDALTRALEGSHALVANVSDARAVLHLQGAAVREVLAKLTPADTSANALAVGRFRRSRLAQVPAAFRLTDETTAEVICFRSVAEYVFGILSAAAAPGSEVGLA